MKHDLAGRRFGRLRVLSREGSLGKSPAWRCACECGAEAVATTGNLLSGRTESCNCLRLERVRSKLTVDLTGYRYGSLTVTRRAPVKSGAVAEWECRCDCGRDVRVRGVHLKTNHTRSCGCRKMGQSLDSAHVLYRLYDADDDLLYIGITYAWSRRRYAHSRTQPWWDEVVSMTQTPYPDRASVLAAEKAAIRTESPVFNKVRYLGET